MCVCVCVVARVCFLECTNNTTSVGVSLVFIEKGADITKFKFLCDVTCQINQFFFSFSSSSSAAAHKIYTNSCYFVSLKTNIIKMRPQYYQKESTIVAF